MSEEKSIYDGGTKTTRCDVPDYIAKWNHDSLSEYYYTQDFVTALNLKIDMLLMEVNRLRMTLKRIEEYKEPYEEWHYRSFRNVQLLAWKALHQGESE